MMSLISVVSLLSIPLIIPIPFLGISLPTVASANPASDKIRFQEVSDQLDFGWCSLWICQRGWGPLRFG